MPIQLVAIKRPNPEEIPAKADTPTDKAKAKQTKAKPQQSKEKPQQSKTKKPLPAPSFIKIKPVDPEATPPILKPFEPLTIEEDGKFYQAIAQLSGQLIEVDGYLYLKHFNALIQLKAVKSMKKRLLKQIGRSVAVTGWPTHSGQQLMVFRLTEPSEKNVIMLAGLVKKSDEEGKLKILIPRNHPTKTEHFGVFVVATDTEIRPKTKFIRCYANFNDQGELKLTGITTSAPFAPRYSKTKDATED